MLGEVSQCNDDNTDNRFYEPVGRFPAIEEDEAPYRSWPYEYPQAKEKMDEMGNFGQRGQLQKSLHRPFSR